MNILYEWNFHNRVCRVVESEPGIVQRNRTNNVTQAKRAGYDFEEVRDA